LYEIIIVDNASSDGTADYLGKLKREFKVLTNKENLGFARACNQGAAAAAGKYLVFLNNDTIPQSGWLEELINFAESNPEIGIVGSKLLYPDGSIQHAGIELINGIPDHPFRYAPNDLPQVCEIKELDMVTGACLLIRKDLFEECGLFDEAYLNGVEDIDLCLKVRSRGFKVVYNPKSVLYHYEGKTPGRFKHVSANLSLFRSRWGQCFGENGKFIRLRRNIPSHQGRAAGKIGEVNGAKTAQSDSGLAIAHSCADTASHSGGIAKRFIGKGTIEPLRVIWEGSQFVYHSLALVNRELCMALAKHSDVELSLIPYERHQFDASADPDRFPLIADRMNRPLSKPAEFHIRLQWPPNFEPPSAGHWIMMQPWEYGALPEKWIEPMRSQVDELWVPSNFVGEIYKQSGIPAEKIQVIPLGVDHHIFHPRAPKFSTATNKSFKFLYVGGTIWRKGIDILLKAYSEAFSDRDDVCLVIKDMGAGSFYKGQNAAKQIQQIQKEKGAPEICYLTENLSNSQVAGLYTACDCLVHPYRGEGFGLPVAEAMACGLPVIVTRGGACDDFCSEESVFFIKASRRPAHISGHKLISPGWVLEPDKRQLIERLKYVFENPAMANRKGRLATREIKNKLNWQKSADLILERLKILRNKPICRFGQIRDNQQNIQAGGIVLKSTEEMYQDIQALMENQWHEAAIHAYEKLLESYPEFAPAYSDLGALYYKIGDKEKALEHYEKAAQLEPNNTAIQKTLADFYYAEQGKVEDALRIYTAILESCPDDVETIMISGHLSVALHKFDDAKACYGRVMEIEPWNAEAQQYLDKLMNMSLPESKFETAEQWYQSLQSKMSSDQPEMVIADLEKLLQSYPDFALAHNDLGVLCYNRGEKEKALVYYEKAAQLAPENVTFKKNLADFYYVEQNRVEDALKLYVQVLTMNPQDVETLLITGHICIYFEQFDDAKVFFNRVLEIEPLNADAREVLDKLQNLAQRESEPKTPEEMYQEIQPLMEGNDSQPVINELEALLRVYPDFALAHNDLGVLYYGAGDMEKALNHYEQAAQLESGNITFKKNLADFYYVEQGRVEDALRLYVDALAINPQDVETLLITGHICVALQQFDDAKVFYRRVVEIEPWNTDARQNLETLDLKRKAV
jgi:GT2 family glycosyltransferase/tetratricopeptide (TPR) repeat protein